MADACLVCGDELEEAGEAFPVPAGWSIGRGVVCAACAAIDPRRDGAFRRCAHCEAWTFENLGRGPTYCSRSCRDAADDARPLTPLHRDGDYLRKARAEDAAAES